MIPSGIISPFKMKGEHMCFSCDIQTIAGLSNSDLMKLGSREDFVKKILNYSEHELAIVLGDKDKAKKLKLIQKLSNEMYKQSFDKKLQIESPRILADYYRTNAYDEVEITHIMYLDNKNCMISEEILSVGTVNATLVCPREILIKALRNEAVQIALTHNHPSGDHTPSQEDELVAKRIHKAGAIVGIHVLDFLVVSSKGYTSFKELGHLG